jgi:hypothetical protein
MPVAPSFEEDNDANGTIVGGPKAAHVGRRD